MSLGQIDSRIKQIAGIKSVLLSVLPIVVVVSAFQLRCERLLGGWFELSEVHLGAFKNLAS